MRNGKENVDRPISGWWHPKAEVLSGHAAPENARLQHADLRTQAKRGIDARREERAAAKSAQETIKQSKDKCLGLIVPMYLAHAATKLRASSFRCAKLYLTKHWNHLHEAIADAITRSEIRLALHTYENRTTSAQMLRHLSACLSWACEQEMIERNVCVGIKAPVHQFPRDRVLLDDELKTLWEATDGSTDTIFSAIVRLLLLTGQRKQEIAGLQRREVDLDRKRILLPGARTKNGKPHEIPLCRQAMDILQRTMSNSECLFKVPSWSGAKARLDKRCQFATPFVIHDLRRTAVTRMAEIGVAPHVIEAVVNHLSGHKAGVAGVYNHARYTDEKRNALQRWANHIDEIVSGRNRSKILQFG